MGTNLFCDKCKELIDEKKITHAQIYIRKRGKERENINSIEFDLCEKCLEELKDWLLTKEVK